MLLPINIMRLLNTKTLCLEFFVAQEVQYAILSHTWGEEEVTFEHMSLKNEDVEKLKGWEKIGRSCAVAAALKYEYIWIDTCCIDKASSAELSEAINSMFEWYVRAGICIAYLNDVPSTDDLSADVSDFRRSRWFSRGWTLQELIAPQDLSFYSKDWDLLGTRDSLKGVIRECTRVPDDMLRSRPGVRSQLLRNYSVAEKMSWASYRRTTRPEDEAYCLLGIFDINMPLIYGEGRLKAFKRLQEEIVKSTSDESIYAWRQPEGRSLREEYYWGLLARTPLSFRIYDDLATTESRYLTRSSSHATTMSNRGLHVELAMTPFPNDKSGSIFLAFLDCDVRREKSSTALTPAILLQRTSWYNETDFVRIRPYTLVLAMMNRIVMPDEIAAIAQGDSETRDPALAEAEPRQIFIPHNFTAPRSPHGFIFHPTIGFLDEGPMIVKVISRSSSWHHSAEKSMPVLQGSYVLDFDLSPVPGVTELKAPTILGSFELEIKQPDSWNIWHICLVVGLEPLPPNAFETPPLYVEPWYAFETQVRVAAGAFTDVLNKDTRKKDYLLLNKDTRKKDHSLLKQSLRVSIDLGSRYSRLFYRVVLQLHTEEKPAKSIGWLPTRYKNT